jgi:glycosyltransferase involved in cell wall biosynthesis
MHTWMQQPKSYCKSLRKVVLTGFKFKHHGEHAGYDLLHIHVPDRIWINRDDYDYTVQSWWQIKGLSRINLILEKWRDYRYILALKNALKNASTVHFLYPENTLSIYPHEIPLSIKVIATFHQPQSWWIQKLNHPGSSKELARYTRVNTAIVLSKELIPIVRDSIGIRDVKFIHHGVDRRFFKPNTKKRARKRVLVLGTWKRDLDLLETVLKLATQLDSEIEFRLIMLPRISNRYSKITRVTCLHNMSDDSLLDELQQNSILFLPLVEATANNALLEAASCGLPIMATYHDSLTDYFSSKEIFYFNYSDHSIAEKIVGRLIDILNNEGLMIEKQQLILDAAKSYDWDHISKKINQLYV